MKMRIIGAVIVTLACLGNSPAIAEEQYPAKTVRLLVGYAPGSTTDLVGRIVAEGLRKRLGQPFVVENRTGANGMLAAEAVAKAKPDGYTIFVANSSVINVNPLLYKNIRYDVHKDFLPVTTVVSSPMVLVINSESPVTAEVRRTADLKAAGEKKGKPLTYGSAGNGNLLHLAGAQLAGLTGMDATHVPYRGAALMQTALLGQEIDFSFNTVAGMPHIKAGKFRALMVTAAERWPDLPDVPSAKEEGLDAMVMPIWTGLMVPAGTPAEIISLLRREVAAALEDPELRPQLELQGRITLTTPEEFSAQIRKELDENAKIIKANNIKIE